MSIIMVCQVFLEKNRANKVKLIPKLGIIIVSRFGTKVPNDGPVGKCGGRLSAAWTI